MNSDSNDAVEIANALLKLKPLVRLLYAGMAMHAYVLRDGHASGEKLIVSRSVSMADALLAELDREADG